jgi:alpha-beta hydrolase superfamily lysophospholipase
MLAVSAGHAQVQPAAQPPAVEAPATYTIFVRAVPIGSEQIGLEAAADGGMTIVGSGRLGVPLDLQIRKMRIRYGPDWKPLELELDSTLRGQTQVLKTTITDGSARSEIILDGKPQEKTDPIDPNAVLLPNPVFAPYVALAARLQNADAGTTIPIYVAPQGSMTATVGPSSNEKIQTLARVIEARRTRITFNPPGGPPLDAEVWGDERGRLLRVSVPAQGVEAVREDVASVAARRVTISREGDEQVRIPANGFSLAGTISRPAGSTAAPLPALVLVGGSGLTDRDETVAGIPIFGQLANALADAGFIVLRYDKRGVGQSGGRPEAATLADFAEDLRAAVRFMAARKDVDRRRLAVAGHSEGGSVAMIAATREDRIAALALLASIGVTGADLNMAQVTHALDRSGRPPAERQSTIELQKKIQAAVLTGQGWDDIPPALRKQADIPWFQSFLAFDPARVMRDLDQPLLIVQGMLDKQVDPSNADKLEALARARRRSPPVEVVRVPGVNHLLVPATTGEVDEYASLEDKTISPAVPAAIAAWLQKAFVAVR